ncbi:MAG: hypothetical protein A3F84_14680 [Candidatus Handelsmanbacteria bacterium RIFCSPLOWO2_12_FULL_64_10]|uniref:Uncharacterized protein n=1 Tax=Handelsmanbacteria sp. (strain RIFCSPLOWO2_12_FULL_64_10) TaxID=1817868 RepID=A0A1F6CH09_HANXR|nr:MAG: hypothetical protein A3F84_14680 [Candidatus Handelsmanbacteria bacterium RIFCSPLOWO2_12_FULL_64_10]
MTWKSISDMVRELHTYPRPDVSDFRAAAGALAASAYGFEVVAEQPSLINVAALALVMRRLIVHRVTPGAIRTVDETDLHTLPGEPPRLLCGPWVLESRHPDRGEPLVENCPALAGYPLEGAIYLIGFGWPDGGYVARWVPRWGEDDIDTSVQPDDSPLVSDVDAHQAWAKEVARFTLILGLLLDAEGTPVEVEDRISEAGGKKRRGRPRPTRRDAGPGESPGPGAWVERRVSLSRPRQARAHIPPSERGSLPPGRAPATVEVRGHLKRQPYGPGRRERRWVYVKAYEARRWIAPRPLQVVVTK